MSRHGGASAGSIVNNAITNPSSNENWIIANVAGYSSVTFNNTSYLSVIKGHNKSSGTWDTLTISTTINITNYDGLWWYWGQSTGQKATFS